MAERWKIRSLVRRSVIKSSFGRLTTATSGSCQLKQLSCTCFNHWHFTFKTSYAHLQNKQLLYEEKACTCNLSDALYFSYGRASVLSSMQRVLAWGTTCSGSSSNEIDLVFALIVERIMSLMRFINIKLRKTLNI